MKSGTCGCLDYDLTQGDDWQTVYGIIDYLDTLIGDQDDETKQKVVALMCSATVNDGDQLQVPRDSKGNCSCCTAYTSVVTCHVRGFSRICVSPCSPMHMLPCTRRQHSYELHVRTPSVVRRWCRARREPYSLITKGWEYTCCAPSRNGDRS